MMIRKALIGSALLAAAVGTTGAQAIQDRSAEDGLPHSRQLPSGSETVKLDPEDFTTRIDNRYRPMRPGDRSVIRVTTPDGPGERVVTTVTDDTKLIANGVTARVVFTEATEEGELVEDNRAWYAQDEKGNVWYLGERAREFDNGKVTTKGSWEAGVDGAQAGVVMPGRPKVGMAYREEYAKGVAQDNAEVFSLRERAEVPYGKFSRVLLVKETSPLDPPGALDYKFYARGVGPVLGLEISGGSDREELVSFRRRAN